LSKLPILPWHDVVKVLVKAGFQPVRQKGSHLVKDEYIVPVPKHKENEKGLLLEIIAEAGMTKEQFIKLLNEL
jgi:predicted RNA binding protein YcfA (HicA-like mRNA interferase family)